VHGNLGLVFFIIAFLSKMRRMWELDGFIINLEKNMKINCPRRRESFKDIAT
jgi:hypothetical protein